MNTRRIATFIAGFATLVMAALPAVAAAQSSSPTVPSSLAAAIKAEVENRGKQYIGDCAISTGADVGKWCSMVESVTDSSAVVYIGAVFSDEIVRLNFNRAGEAWSTGTGGVVNPTPPALVAAIKAEVEKRGKQYIGDCAQATGADVGKWCSNVGHITADSAVVYIGATFSDELFELKFAKSGDAWALTNGGIVNPPTPQALLDAIKAEVEKRGKQYVGHDCGALTAADINKWCSTIQSMDATKAVVYIGAVVGQTYRLEFQKSGDAWTLTSGGVVSQPSQTAPQALIDAIKAEVEKRGKQYFGNDCGAATGADAGKWCSTVQSIDGSKAVVYIGAVLSDETFRLEFTRSGDSWTLTSGGVSTPTPTTTPGTGTPAASPTPRVPNTGSGSSTGTDTNWLVLTAIFAAGALIAGGGAAAVATRRR